jgi:hypothetical protein
MGRKPTKISPTSNSSTFSTCTAGTVTVTPLIDLGWKSLDEITYEMKEERNSKIVETLQSKQTKVYVTDLTWKDVLNCRREQNDVEQVAVNQVAFLLGYKYYCSFEGKIFMTISATEFEETILRREDINEIL